MRLARPDKSRDVEQQGGLADNEPCPRIPRAPGQQEFKSPARWLGISAVAGLITPARHARKCTRFLLRSCSRWGEKNLIFVVKKHGEILFFQRGKVCLNWKKKKKFSCAYVSQLFFYICILKGRIKNKQILFVCLFVSF